MKEKLSKFCHLCGQRLYGAYYTYNDTLVVCQRCNATKPRCSQCNIPSLEQRLTTVRGVLVCPDCLKKAPVCACCHEPVLKGEHFFKIGDSPLPYCETCVTTRPRCGICRVPFLENEGLVIPGLVGSTNRCAACYQSAVKALPDAERLYRQIHALLQHELQLQIAGLPQLEVVERTRLMQLNHQTGTLVGSNTPVGPEQQHLLGFFRGINGSHTIYIERLLPRTLFQAVAAHELAHAWQSVHAPSGQSPKIVEGFAEWVAYRTLLALGEQREAARLTRRSEGDVYGEGLLYFIKLERERGREAVLQRARQA